MMKRKIGLGVLVCVLVLLAIVLWAMNTTRYEIDRNQIIEAPSSEKSRAEFYNFGYVPPLVYSEQREDCADRNPLKSAFFGDLHIHTALSSDAIADGTTVWPEDAYNFAKGEPILLPDFEGAETMRPVQLDRPLDFAAVTDHSEALGEGYICREEGEFAGYDTKACKTYRKGGDDGLRVFSVPRAGMRPKRLQSVCGEYGQDCYAAAARVWQRIIAAADAAYDKTSGCEFTSFVGYEYTRSPSGMHMHRNTVFKNASVPDLPANYIDQPTLPELLGKLETECRQGLSACDVISIPHNSNISSGNGFNRFSLRGFPEAAQQAHRLQRQAFDRLMEITQHKGASECLNGVTDILGNVDEMCDIEAIRQIGQKERAFDLTSWIPRVFTKTIRECTEDDIDPKDNLYKGPCVASHDFARGAWLSGLEDERGFGVNPFELGVIGSTDTHIGTSGNTSEHSYPGHIAHETVLEGRLGEPGLGRHNRLDGNPGGLAGVWAVENSRDALFQSMKRREAFATSGTRIAPRFFAGRFERDICGQSDWLDTAYAQGVPMGARLPAGVEGLRFVAQAARDPAATASPLSALQIVKGWIDENGQKRFDVTDVASTETGADELCVVYEDPDYDPLVQAYYYLRVVEMPTPRWSKWQCDQVEAEGGAVEGCENDAPETINEFAWTSPIWITPADADVLPVSP
ncbi:MAG: DUF3604 domain-containing protein [Hyphomonadaceae bacterium]